MRRQSHSTLARARLFSLLPLALLVSLSFTATFVNAGMDPIDLGVRQNLEQRMVMRHAALLARQNNGQDEASSASGGDASASTSSVQATSPSTSAAEPTNVIGAGTSSSTSALTSSTSTQSTSSSSSSVASATSTSASSSSSSSSSIVTSSSSSSSSSSTSSFSTSSQTTLATTSSSSTTTSSKSTVTSLVIATDAESSSSSKVTSTSSAKASSAAAAGSTISASSASASSNSFLSNKGAVAGVFTVVGLIAVGGIVAVYILYKKRKRSEDLDIFDSEYKSNKDSFFGGPAADRTSLSANAMAYAGSGHTDPFEHDYGHAVSDFGLGMPPQMVQNGDRTSITSNHAGYGAFQAASQTQAPPASLQPAAAVPQPHAPAQRSRLRNVSYGDEGARNGPYSSPYSDPAVAEHESVFLQRESIYGGMQQQTYGTAR